MACAAMPSGNLKKDLDEVNIGLFSAVTAWLRKRGKVRPAARWHSWCCCARTHLPALLTHPAPGTHPAGAQAQAHGGAAQAAPGVLRADGRRRLRGHRRAGAGQRLQGARSRCACSVVPPGCMLRSAPCAVPTERGAGPRGLCCRPAALARLFLRSQRPRCCPAPDAAAAGPAREQGGDERAAGRGGQGRLGWATQPPACCLAAAPGTAWRCGQLRSAAAGAAMHAAFPTVCSALAAPASCHPCLMAPALLPLTCP